MPHVTFLIMEPEVLVDTNSVREVMGFTGHPFKRKFQQIMNWPLGKCVSYQYKAYVNTDL